MQLSERLRTEKALISTRNITGMAWKRFAIFLSSLLLCFLGGAIYVFSCGPEPDPYDYYPNFYNPGIVAGTGFEPFYYTGIASHYGQEETEESVNIREWNTFFNGKIKAKDLREFIYTYSRPQMTALYTYIDKGTKPQLPDSVMKNPLSRYLIDNKDRETLGYLMYAKQCEQYADRTNEWNVPSLDSAIMARLSNNGLQLYNACKNQQIKERFAFQSIRMAHYSKALPQAIQLYDSLAAPIRSTSLIHYKALALKAGALRRTNQEAKSAYLFSRIFENAPSQRLMAYHNAEWSDAKQKDVFKFCANNSEKATVAAMYAFRTPDYHPNGLREVYQLDPGSPMLEVLLTREMNKLEDGLMFSLLNAEDYRSWEIVPTPARLKVISIQKLADSIAAAKKVKEPALWHISSAYISFMLKDYAGANKRLAAARSDNNRPALQDQWEVVNLLLAINQQPRIDKDFEEKLLRSFKWLDIRIAAPKTQYYYYDAPPDNKVINEMFYIRMFRNLLDFVIAPRYAKQNDLVRKAQVLMKRDQVDEYSFRYGVATGKEYITDSLNMEQLLVLYNAKQQKRKTPYEQYLYDNMKLTDSELGEIIAVNYVRQHDFTNAVTWFKRSGSSTRSGKVFTEQLQDFGFEEEDSIKNGISQLEYAEKMVALEKKMKGKASPEDYYQYATGLFNISYYGQSYHFSTNYRSSRWWYKQAHDKNPFLKEYFGCFKAEEYYKKAADASTNKEFKAKALFMAARCAQKHINTDKENWSRAAIYKNPYFPALAKDYSNTAFYREIIGECSYLKDFVKTKPQ